MVFETVPIRKAPDGTEGGIGHKEDLWLTVWDDPLPTTPAHKRPAPQRNRARRRSSPGKRETDLYQRGQAFRRQEEHGTTGHPDPAYAFPARGIQADMNSVSARPRRRTH